MRLSAKTLFIRFGQLSTFVMAAALAAAAAPQALSAAPFLADERPPAKAAEVRLTPLVKPKPVQRVLTFDEPVAGRPVNSNFGLRRLAGEPAARMHQGVDIAAPTGVRVMASAEGVVTASGYDAGYGNYVEIRHPNGLRTFYGHLSRVERGVVAGAPVSGGQTIGRVGSTGHSTGPHLHFEVRRRGVRLDPAQYLGRAFVLDA